MRNLALISGNEVNVPSGFITSTTNDLDEDVTYVASERHSSHGKVEIDLWKLHPQNQSNELNVPTTTILANTSTDNPSGPQIVSIRFMAEARKIAIIMCAGDVIVVSMEEEGKPFEVEGTFESGILAASWNPDESVVAIVTGDHKLILLTSLFDVLVESPLYTEDFGQAAPINVGWGSKQTQFHGSLGKAAAQEIKKVEAGISPDDDLLPRISWRGDGALFAVSSLSPADIPDSRRHRTLRIYNRQGVLQSTSEEVAGLEHTLVWRPSGNVITSTQRFGFEGGGSGREGRHDVIFFERNGLRHGEFSLKVDQLSVKPPGPEFVKGRKWGYNVKEVAWNSDSNVLSVWIEGDWGDIVQFWTMANYHWYLKHEMAAPAENEKEPGRFTSLNWHPERPLHILLTTSKHVIQRIYSWDTFISHSTPPNDSGAVAVVDGPTILLTPFRSQNVPPPMSSHQLNVSPEPSISRLVPTVSTPIYITFSPEDDTLGILWEHGYVELWSLKISLLPGPARIMNPSKTWSGWVDKRDESSDLRSRQLAVETLDVEKNLYRVTVLGARHDSVVDHISDILVDGGLVKGSELATLPRRNSRFMTPGIPKMFQMHNGEILTYDQDTKDVQIQASFGDFCLHAYQVTLPSKQIFYVGLAKTGKLYASSKDRTCLISINAISFAITPGFIIFTTTAHEAIFVPLTYLPILFVAADAQSMDNSTEPVFVPPPKHIPPDWSVRKVERGSRIVVAVATSMSLVLQLPRGNLETINPRPLVLEVVKQDLDSGNYRKAFLACRKHRIDLNFVVDHNPVKFIQDIQSFVDQVPEVDHINVFLTLIGRGPTSPEIITKICDAFLHELEKRDLATYVNSILTAHVVKFPPDHESGLRLLLRLRDSHPDAVEEAVKYIIFLIDADTLFDTALGMYDFSLVLMIAQQSQKDPREYLPFLRELRAMNGFYQRFRIDDHLKRYESALRNLSCEGLERFEEALEYVEKHRLYKTAIAIWKGTPQYKDILNTYGDYLYERREFREAAGVFAEASRLDKAMVAHEKALEWQELFDLAVRNSAPKDDIVAMGYRVAEDLCSKKRYAEAARVLLDYSEDIREALIALTAGNSFAEARRMITLHSVPELMEDIVYPAALESKAQIVEDINEMKEQLRKQINRLRELRIKKVEDPDAFYGVEDNPALQNVDVMTDVSMAPTTFTRYTVAPTTASRTSRRTSRSKRKMERKVGSGRKGTVDEEEYLLKSVNKLVDRFNITLGETRGLLPHLSQFTEEHNVEGRSLQKIVGDFEAELQVTLDEIWARPIGDNEIDSSGDVTPEGWAARMAAKERSARISPLDRVEQNEISYTAKDWRIPLYEIS